MDQPISTPAVQDEEALKEESKRIGVYEAGAWSVMEGFGNRYVAPFAIAVGANNRQIGLLSSLPSLLGTLSQLITLELMRHWTRKRICILGTTIQAALWLFMIGAGALYFFLGMRGDLPPYAVIIIFTFLVLTGAFGGPAWSSWMKDLITHNIGSFFAMRSRIASIVIVTSMLLAGFILDHFRATSQIFTGFIIIFLIAFMGRSTCAYLLSKQYEPHFRHDDSAYFTFFQFIRKMSGNNYGRFVIFTALISMTVQIGSPYMTVYMLKELGFSYKQYMAVILSSTLMTLILLPAWGRFADRYGNLKILRLTGIFVFIVPILWIFTPYFSGNDRASAVIYLCILQGLTGSIWAGFDLAASNFVYEAVTRQRMAICVTYSSILNGLGSLLGATLGGWISSLSFTFMGLTPIFFVFLLSGLGRLTVYLLVSPKIKEVREVKEFGMKEIGEEFQELSFIRFTRNFRNQYLRRPFQ